MTKFLALRVVPALVLALLAVSCGQRERPGVVARVGRHKVDLASFQAYVGAVIGGGWETVDARLASRLLDQFIDQEVVAAAARVERKIPIPVNPEKRSAVVRGLLGEVCGPPPPPAPALLEREVAERLATPLPTRAHVRQILVDTQEKADQVIRGLAGGADFVALSREISEAANADDGGELGMVSQGTLPPELDAVIFKLAAGEISKPVKSPSGFHIFEVLERTPAGPPARAEVEGQVRREAAEAATRRHVRACIDRLAGEVGVRLLPGHLWFKYDGRYAEERHEGTAAE